MATNNTQEGVEKLRLLGQLAGDDVKALTSAAHQTQKADWPALERNGQIPKGIASKLISLSESDNRCQLIRQTPEIIDAVFQAINHIDQDSNAVLYISELLIDMCKSDSQSWDQLASYRSSDRLTGHDACYKSLERNWREQATNENLAYLLAGFQSHVPALADPRPLSKMIVDPRVVRMSAAGRLAAVANLLYCDPLRVDLLHSSTFRGLLTQGYASKDLAQMYHASVCIWLVSFNSTATSEDGPLSHHRSVLEAFIDMVITCKREKVVRAACLAIKNLVQVEWIFEMFFHRKVDHTLTLLEYEKWRDQDLYENIQDLIKTFWNKTNQYSNFNRYMKELNSGTLVPGPLHTEKFWIENVKACEDNEFGPIVKLSALLLSNDATTISLACFDLGEFSRLHPTGKKIVTKTGAKSRIVDLMSHPNKDVAREALLSTQKMMLDDWRKLGSEAQEKHQKVETRA